MSLSFLFRTDVHVADRNPASWKGDYPSEVLGNLRQVGEIAREHEVAAVLDGGDFFHVKSSGRTSHATIVKVLDIHRKYPCPTYCVEGNHDIVGNNLDTIEQQPLGVLYAAGIFNHLREEVFEKDGLRVRVVGLPYDPTRTIQSIQKTVRKQPGDDYLIAVVHALAAENPPAQVEDFFGEPVYRYGSLVYSGGPDVFCFGHWHRDQGVVEIEGRYFVNQGALSRGSLTKENTQRTPQASLIEMTREKISVTTFPMKVLPAEEVFDLERKERQDTEASLIDQFSEQFSSQLETEIDATQDIDVSLDRLNFSAEVRAMAKEYLEKVRT